MKVTAYIGLGSNLEHPHQQVLTAIRELNQMADSRLTNVSRLYRSPPMGPEDQPDYVNAVAAVETGLEARQLLRQLQALEHRHGRMRSVRWGARTLDLDLLLYGSSVIESPDLKVPHPGLPQRAFVLLPLHDIAPHLHVPGLGSLAELIARLPDSEKQGLVRLDPGDDKQFEGAR